MSTMPALFLSHGAPPLVDDPTWVSQLRELGRRLAAVPWTSWPTSAAARPALGGSGDLEQHAEQLIDGFRPGLAKRSFQVGRPAPSARFQNSPSVVGDSVGTLRPTDPQRRPEVSS